MLEKSIREPGISISRKLSLPSPDSYEKNTVSYTPQNSTNSQVLSNVYELFVHKMKFIINLIFILIYRFIQYQY